MAAAKSSLFQTVLAALGSLLNRRDEDVAAERRTVVLPWREDAVHTYPTIGLTPSKALALLQAADRGAPRPLFELYAQMLQKWPRLGAVEQTRRLALTGLEWEVLPGPGCPTGADEAQEAAVYCAAALRRVSGLRAALAHLAGALGYGVAVLELVWDGPRLVELVPVPATRLLTDAREPWRLRVRTQDEPALGIALDEHPNKWIVHRPPGLARPFEGGLLRASVPLYVAQNLSLKDWLIYSQIAGMPVRIAQYDHATSDADRQALLKLLQTLGTDGVAVVGKNIELKLLDSPRAGERPYEPLQRFCNTEVTILWLGQHLTTEIQSSGSRAAAEIHDRVREDLLVQDVAEESETVSRDLLGPLTRLRFGADAPVPVFRRSLAQAVDTRVLADVLAVAVNQVGLAVPRGWAHRALGIPEAQADEPVLTRSGS